MAACGVVAVIIAVLALQNDPAKGLHDPEVTRFLTLAVFEGLFEDGAEADVVKAVASDRHQLFIAKCPICHPVKHAFEMIAAAPPPDLYNGRGAGLPKDLLAQLRSSDLPTRKRGLEALVKRYIDRRFERVKMSEAERVRLRRRMEDGREKGMSYAGLKPGGFCPSCDGAAKPK